jgi:hypothetical protein
MSTKQEALTKQQATINLITEARKEQRPELTAQVVVTQDGKSMLLTQGDLPPVRIGASGGVYLPESKSFANSTPQTDPTPLEAGIWPDRFTNEAIEARRKEKAKATAAKKAEADKAKAAAEKVAAEKKAAEHKQAEVVVASAPAEEKKEVKGVQPTKSKKAAKKH